MTTKAQLIWDFRGPNAFHTAKHHKIHLEEFIAIEHLEVSVVTITEISDLHVIVSFITPMEKVSFLRERLKPHRGKKVVV